MKKINLAFGIVLALVLIAAVLHPTIVYLNWSLSPDYYYSSAPAGVAYFLLVPYGIAILALSLVWLVVGLVKRRKACYNGSDEIAR